jgi:hypothetical protein
MYPLMVWKDDPGKRLVLEEVPGFAIAPVVTIGCLATVFVLLSALPIRSLARAALAGESLLALLVAGAFELLIGAGLLLAVWQTFEATRHVVRLAADAKTGALRIDERGLLGWPSRSRLIRFDQLVAATCEGVVGGGREDAGRGPLAAFAAQGAQVTLHLWIDGTAREEGRKRFRLSVLGLDKREEVADLALRLAAVCGLGYYEVTQSDPRRVTVELSGVRSGTLVAAPLPERRASYDADRVAETAREAVAQEKLPPFDAASFPSEFRVTNWEPGVIVRLEKPARLAALACLPCSLLLLAGPAAFVFILRHADPSNRLGAAAFALVLGIVLGGAALAAGIDGLPRRVTIDWATGKIGLWRPGKWTEIATYDATAVELVCLRHKPSRGPTTYRCEVKVWRRDRDHDDEERATTLVETRSFAGDADTPYGHALPLATELAAALGVPRRITDYA